MTIREQLDDASFLAEQGRYKGALTILMLAVAASSRRTFPKGIKSKENPKVKMEDQEAFTLFLGGRIRKILFRDYGGPEEGESGLSVEFRGVHHDVSYILYKFYRCELVHGGELPKDVEFAAGEPPETDQDISIQGVRVSIETGDTFVLDHGWLKLLTVAVSHARCNGAEFGIEHLDLVPLPNIDDATFLASLVEKYRTSPARVQMLKHAVRKLSPRFIAVAVDDALVDAFSKLVQSQEINGGAIAALSLHGLTDRQGVLQKRGTELLREIASGYQLAPAT